MFFKPSTMDEACVQAQYLENIGHKRAQPSSSKQKEHQEASKEAKKKWKGVKDKKTTGTIHQLKDPSNHCNHCNIDGHTEKKCWKLHPELNLKNRKKDAKKKNLLAMDSSNQVESNSDVDEKIVCTSVQKEVNLSNLRHRKEKEMTKLFHIETQVKKTKIDALFDFGS
jgi:hypothetical protein